MAQTKAEEQFISIRVTEDARTWTAEQWDDEARRHALYACERQCVKHTHTHTHTHTCHVYATEATHVPELCNMSCPYEKLVQQVCI